jgi:cyclic pyranopterin phosphate synthase
MAFIDPYGRKINYLRISITDHCNLRCSYCMPEFSDRALFNREEILSYEELTTVAKVAVEAGISKIRISGGEPLLRKGIVTFCSMLNRIKGLQYLALTTNGIFLKKLAFSLRQAGVQQINISLDTLRRDRFHHITGRDHLHEVLASIKAAADAGCAIKINTVVMRGINDDEIEALAALTNDNEYYVRFIELMPFQNASCGEYDSLFMPVAEILKKMPLIIQSNIASSNVPSGPEKIYKLPGAKGKIGFIAPMSWNICDSCNRLRLTVSGKIRSCLFGDHEIDIKTPLRQGTSKKDITNLFRRAVAYKPHRHLLDSETDQNFTRQGLYSIGG